MTPTVYSAALLAEGGPSGGFGAFVPIILMFAVFYFIVLRPVSKQDKERRKRVEGVKKGDQVVLQGGILGRISNADDPKIAVVEIADRVKVKVLKSKIDDTAAAALEDKDAKNAKKGDDGSKADKADKASKDAKSETEAKAKDKGARKGA